MSRFKEGHVQISVRLPEEERRAVRVLAAKHDMTMETFIRGLLRVAVSRGQLVAAIGVGRIAVKSKAPRRAPK